MRKAKTITDLDARYRLRVKNLTEEYDHQRLQSQTYADYMVALLLAYEQERSRINGEVVACSFLKDGELSKGLT